MLVEKSIYNKTVEKVKEVAGKLKVDLASKKGGHIGPVVSKTQFDKIQTLIQKGIDEGAKLVAGGTGKPKGLDKGYFVKPTAFADVNNNMQIARTEIFGQFYQLFLLKLKKKQSQLQMIRLMVF